MSENEVSNYERGRMHGEHSRRFYVWGTAFLVAAGVIGGVVLQPDDWHPARAILTGVLIALLSGYCVFAWHWLLGTVEEQ